MERSELISLIEKFFMRECSFVAPVTSDTEDGQIVDVPHRFWIDHDDIDLAKLADEILAATGATKP